MMEIEYRIMIDSPSLNGNMVHRLTRRAQYPDFVRAAVVTPEKFDVGMVNDRTLFGLPAKTLFLRATNYDEFVTTSNAILDYWFIHKSEEWSTTSWYVSTDPNTGKPHIDSVNIIEIYGEKDFTFLEDLFEKSEYKLISDRIIDLVEAANPDCHDESETE